MQGIKKLLSLQRLLISDFLGKKVRNDCVPVLNSVDNNIKKNMRTTKALPHTRRANPRKGSTRRAIVSATVVHHFLYIYNIQLLLNQ